MGSLKRKEGPGGSSAPKSAKPTTDARPSKRAKASGDSKKDATKKESKPASAAVSSLIREEEPMFPRGGASVLTPLEQKEIKIQAKKDVLFEEATGKQKGGDKEGKKKRKSKHKEGDKKASKDEDSVKIESLNFKRLVKGSLVLGTVSAISPLNIAIALPNNLTGHVSITAVSETLTKKLEASAQKEDAEESNDDDDDDDDDDDENDVDLASMFRLGQYVRAYVVSTMDESALGKPRRHIELSLMPAHANSGMTEQDVVENCTLMASVVSVEDHGFVMDVGISDSKVNGFLPRKQLDKSIPEEAVQPGCVLFCVATGKAANGKVVQLSTLEDRLGSTKYHPSEATTIDSYLPGTAADILVSEVSQHGIVGKLMGSLDVTADLVHSGAGPDGVDLEDKYKVGSRLKARIICTFPAAKHPKLGISILPHVLSLKPKMAIKDGREALPVDILAHSAIVEKCTVQRVEPEIGLYVDVGVEGVPGFVHISRVKDGKVDSLFENSGPYKVGSVHPGRVVGYNSFDGMFLLSMEKSILEQLFLRIEDIPVGAVVPGVVEKLVVNQAGLGGVIVKISEGISGLVPEMHLADVHLQHPEKKFKEGMKVKTRVLSTNPAKHQVRLTLKKTLVNSDALPVKSHEDLAVGLQAYGTIINILEKGAIVQFYGRLRGFLPVSEMSEAYIHDPKDHFRVGQTVSVYVLSFDPEEHRMIISCKDPSAFGLEKQLALKKLQIGDLVSAKVTQKTEDDIFVELDEGSLKAILPVMHLTDKSVSKTLSALKKIHVNQSLTELVVLEKNESRRSITISHKPSLVQASKEGKLLSNVNNAQVGDVVPGFIRSTTATAAFVQFAGKLVALLPKSKIPREDQDKPGFGFHKTQSVLVKIINVDRDLGRLVVAIPSTVREEANEPSKQAESAIVNALDESIKSLEDLAIGKLTKARVKSAKETQINVDIADNIQGRIDVSQVFDTWEGIKDPKKPLKSFKTNDIIQVRVLGVHDARNHTYLPITHRSTHSVLELTAKPSDLKEDAAPAGLSYSKLEQGSSYLAFVNNVAPTHIWVNLSPNVRGRINATELSHDLSKLVDISKSFPVGSALKVRVISVDAEKKRLDLSALTPGSENQMSWDKIKRGMVLPGRVTKVDDRQVFVKLSDTLAAPVALVDLSDDYDEANPLKYTKHDIVRVVIVDIDKSNKKLRLSMRPSRVLSSASPVTDKEITKNTKVEVGDIVRGFVKNVADKGLFVALGGDVVAMVKIKNLSDSYLKDWKEHYQVGQLVKGRIISVADGRLEMSLKPSVVDKDWVPLLTISDLKEGQVITGKVRKVEEFGAFIDIHGSDNLSGLCHRSEMADRSVNDAKTLYNEGDVVKARVIKVDVKAKRVSLGLKPSYFKDGDDDEMDVDSDDAGAALNDDDDSDADSDEEMSDAGGAIVITGTDAAGDDSDEDEDVEMAEVQEGIKGLETGGFDWNGDALDADDKTTADDTVAPSKKKRREPQIQVDKTAQLDVNGPQTIDDYERLLLGEPNSSALWVAYMAFKMQTSDLSSAREVAKRAIKTINIKEETEKLNVWIAYLNLEVAYGTDETVEEVFKEACTYNDAQEVHERLASIYIQSGKFKEAEDIFEKIVKKYGSKSTDVWINYAHFLHAKANNPERARALIKRATQSLGTATHINLALLPKFAALEFRSPNGDRETGRTLFTQLLAAYPKKFDLWNQFMDLETSSDPVDPAQVRDLFESGSKAKGLKAKQAKSWFRRWAKWEEENGDKKSRERVSAKAQEWARTAEERKKSAAAAAEEEGYEDDEE